MIQYREIVDLMLTMVQAGTEQAADLGYGDDAYFAALEATLDAAVKLLGDLPDKSRQAATQRLLLIAKRAADIGGVTETTFATSPLGRTRCPAVRR